jgi:hypothetical protein
MAREGQLVMGKRKSRRRQPGQWCGWLRRIGLGLRPLGWQKIAERPTEAECHKATQEARRAVPYALCEWVVLPAHERPEVVLKRRPALH